MLTMVSKGMYCGGGGGGTARIDIQKPRNGELIKYSM